MTVLYFVRHGETDVNREQRVQGKIDKSLNELGMKQARQTASEFEKIKIDVIYSSPLLRALKTAEYIAQRKGLPITIKDWLQEIDHGELEGLNWEEAEAVAPGILAAWRDHPETVRFRSGENLEQVQKRLLMGLKEILGVDHGKNIMFVTHQVLTGAARCYLEQRPLSEIWNGKLVPGGYFKFALNDNKISEILSAVVSDQWSVNNKLLVTGH